MPFDLRAIYNALYKDGLDGKPLFCEKRQHQDSDPQDFSYFSHPATIRWALPALSGAVSFHMPNQDEKTIFLKSFQAATNVKNHKDFLHLHFMPVYESLSLFLDTNNSELNKRNLQDLMGRNNGIFKSSGSGIRKELLDRLRDEMTIQQFVNTQQAILELYDYRPESYGWLKRTDASDRL